MVVTKHSRIIVGAMAFEGNPYDGHTLDEQLDQVERVTGKLPRVAIVDRGYRGRKVIDETKICTPGKLKASSTPYQKQKVRKRFRARAGIEPIIGHVKHDHRMERNFLAGVIGDQINEDVELYRIEVYNAGNGIGSILMNAFNEVSKKTGINIKLKLGTPGKKYDGTNDEKQRKFYHRNGFRRSKTSEYWYNTEMI